MNQFSFPSLFKIVESTGIITALFYSQTIFTSQRMPGLYALVGEFSTQIPQRISNPC